MVFEYPKLDLRKKEKISIRLDQYTFKKLNDIAEKQNSDLSRIIRDIIIKTIKE